MTINKEQAIRILANFGFKVYNSGKEQYFLQSTTKIKPMTKYSMEKMLSLLNPEEPKSVVETIKEVVSPKKKVTKKEDVENE